MSEPQYQTYFDMPKEQLGSMASQYWRDDPKLLGIHLSRYKFVSKLVSGKKKVADIGCGDGFFSKLVKEQVGELHLYDFDEKFVNECEGHLHNILEGQLPYRNYDAIYTLDCLEHIDLDKQDLAILNISSSLNENGMFICGVPSAESQPYASIASKIGHVGCLTYHQLKSKLEAHFHNVIILTINDEQLGLSFEKMANYYMAVCCGIR